MILDVSAVKSDSPCNHYDVMPLLLTPPTYLFVVFDTFRISSQSHNRTIPHSIIRAVIILYFLRASIASGHRRECNHPSQSQG